ncbi:hypothetical protein BDW68DRAFT_192958 [Aspergillus falconensis]
MYRLLKARCRIPDASIPVASVQHDIADLASNGAGGLQFVPFYYYGNPSNAPPLTDWNVFGFGTEAFRHLFEGALEAAVENNVVMDFALGASQGQGTPAEPGTEGLSLQLQLGVMTVNPGTLVAGPVPGPQNLSEALLSGGGFMHGLAGAERGELKAVIAGRVISESAGDSTATKQVRLDEQSIIDLDQFVENGHLNWQAPAGNGNWKIFSFWEGFTNQVSCTGGVNGTTAIEKGSLVVDHFSQAGARLHTDFFDNHVLVDSTINEGLKTHSAYAWEDSMELVFALPWTRGFLTRFETTHGYSLIKYLPLLFSQANSWGEQFPPYPEEYDECYQEYLHSHVQWSKSHGIGFSAQTSYNLPLSFANEIPAVDGPEGESLTFGDRLDAYRSLSGPAQLAGKTDISSEVAAVSGSAFSQTIPDLLLSIKSSYAGGLTMMVIHGMSYSGPYVGTSWPGYQPFAFRFTDTWSRVQPSWQHMKDTLDYLGRTQHILKAGKPRIDLAMYYSPSRWSSKQLYDSDTLQQGYAYNFIGPQNLQLPEASVSDRLLAPNGPGIDDEVLSKVKEFSLAGLPVFFVGDVESLPLSAQPNATGNASDMVKELIENDNNIHHVSTNDELPAALERAEIMPRLQIDAFNSSVLSVYRTEPESGIDYIWLFNDAAAAISFTADCRVHGDPLKPLTGERPPWVAYGTGQVEAINYNKDGKLVASLKGPAVVTINGTKNKTLTAVVPSPTELKYWDLEIHDWRAIPNDTTTVEPQILVHKFANQSLLSWKDISPELEAMSGIGIYSAKFAVPNINGIGGLLSVGPIFHTLRAWVNGHQLDAFGADGVKVDITPYIHRGCNNTIRIEVSTPLYNRLKADVDTIWQMGAPLESQAYGLLGPVAIDWVVNKFII